MTQISAAEGMVFLLAHKSPALPNLQDRFGSTALHYAVMRGDNPAKVRLLLDHGADKTIRNRDGETALDWARKYNRTEGMYQSARELRPKAERVRIRILHSHYK